MKIEITDEFIPFLLEVIDAGLTKSPYVTLMQIDDMEKFFNPEWTPRLKYIKEFRLQLMAAVE